MATLTIIIMNNNNDDDDNRGEVERRVQTLLFPRRRVNVGSSVSGKLATRLSSDGRRRFFKL